jgi:hypothetical protein
MDSLLVAGPVLLTGIWLSSGLLRETKRRARTATSARFETLTLAILTVLVFYTSFAIAIPLVDPNIPHWTYAVLAIVLLSLALTFIMTGGLWAVLVVRNWLRSP